MATTSSSVTLLLEAVRHGEDGAEERLFRAVYEELRRMARGRAFRWSPHDTLAGTALAHEAYLRLTAGGAENLQNRRHFFGAASRAMRQILVDRWRKRRAERVLDRVPLDDVPEREGSVDLPALDEALNRLAAERPRHAEVVALRFFLGFTVAETASLLELSPKTVDNDWALAKSWLRREMSRGGATEHA